MKNLFIGPLLYFSTLTLTSCNTTGNHRIVDQSDEVLSTNVNTLRNTAYANTPTTDYNPLSINTVTCTQTDSNLAFMVIDLAYATLHVINAAYAINNNTRDAYASLDNAVGVWTNSRDAAGKTNEEELSAHALFASACDIIYSSVTEKLSKTSSNGLRAITANPLGTVTSVSPNAVKKRPLVLDDSELKESKRICSNVDGVISNGLYAVTDKSFSAVTPTSISSRCSKIKKRRLAIDSREAIELNSEKGG